MSPRPWCFLIIHSNRTFQSSRSSRRHRHHFLADVCSFESVHPSARAPYPSIWSVPTSCTYCPSWHFHSSTGPSMWSWSAHWHPSSFLLPPQSRLGYSHQWLLVESFFVWWFLAGKVLWEQLEYYRIVVDVECLMVRMRGMMVIRVKKRETRLVSEMVRWLQSGIIDQEISMCLLMGWVDWGASRAHRVESEEVGISEEQKLSQAISELRSSWADLDVVAWLLASFWCCWLQ